MSRSKNPLIPYSRIEEITYALLREKSPRTLDEIQDVVQKELNLTPGQLGKNPAGTDRIRCHITSCLDGYKRRTNLIVNQVPGTPKGSWCLASSVPQVQAPPAPVPSPAPQVQTPEVPTETPKDETISKVETTPEEPPAPVPAPVETPKVTITVAVETPAPVVETAPVETAPVVEIPAPVVEPETPVKTFSWVEDPYLRHLAISQTGCFNYWSPKAEPCKECPLAVFCRASQAAALSYLADSIKAPVVVPEKVESVKVKVMDLLDDTSKPKTPTPKNGVATPTGKFILAAYETQCCITKKPIQKGQKCIYIPGSGLALPEDQR